MDPFTIAFIASTAFSVLKTFETGGLQKQAAALNKQIADLNSANAEHDAYEAVREGYSKAATYNGKVDQVLDTQNNNYAYADVDTSFGTAQQVQAQSKLNGRLNAMDITNAAYSKAIGFNRQALDYQLSGVMKQAAVNGQADANDISSVIGAGTKLAINSDKFSFPSGNNSDSDSTTTDAGLNYWTSGSKGPDNLGLSLSDNPPSNDTFRLRL